MNAAVVILRWLILLVAMIASPPVSAVWIEDEIATDAITVTASSEFGSAQAARHLLDGSGMQDGLHDNNGSATTMWHTTQWPAPTSAAAGLPASPAWVRFDFAQPQQFDSIHLWNHNQANLTDRGFRQTRIFGSSDGAVVVRADLAGGHRVAARQRQPGAGSGHHREYREDSRVEIGRDRGGTEGRKLRRRLFRPERRALWRRARSGGGGFAAADGAWPARRCRIVPTGPMANRAAKLPSRSEARSFMAR